MFDCSDVDERECIHTEANEKHLSMPGASSRIWLRLSAASPNRSIRHRSLVVARKPARDHRPVDGALYVDVQGQTGQPVEGAAGRAPGCQIVRRRPPALEHHVDTVAVRLIGDQDVSCPPTRNHRVPVVPEARVVVELKREERRRVTKAHRGVTREPEIDERVRSVLVDGRPGVADVGLARVDTVPLGSEVPLARHVLPAAACERRVLVVRVRGVLDPARRLKTLPVDERSGVVLVSVRPLERGGWRWERVLRGRQRLAERRWSEKKARCEHRQTPPEGAPQTGSRPAQTRHRAKTSCHKAKTAKTSPTLSQRRNLRTAIPAPPAMISAEAQAARTRSGIGIERASFVSTLSACSIGP